VQPIPTGNPERTYPFLKTLPQPFHKARRKTLGLVIAAIAAIGQAPSGSPRRVCL